jgi:hypothetical protein
VLFRSPGHLQSAFNLEITLLLDNLALEEAALGITR